MGMESFSNVRRAGEAARAVADTVDVAESLAPAFQAVENGLKIACVFAGLAGQAEKLAKAAVDRGYIQAPVAMWLAKMPKVAMLRVALSLIAPLSAGEVSGKQLAGGLNTAYSISQAASKSKNDMLMQHQLAETPEVKMQHFIDQVRDPAAQLRQEFGTTSDPVKQQAYRFVIANIFIAYKNRIEREDLQKAPGYQEAVEKIVGVPIDVVDLYDSNSAYRQSPENYQLFKKTMFEIYESDACNQVQLVVDDDRVLEYYEVLDRANDDQQGYEEYRRDNTKLIDQAIAYFREDKNLEKAIAYVNPEMAARIPEDSFAKRVPLDIPDKLQG